MKKVFLAVILFFLLISCNKNPFDLCKKSKCQISGVFPGVIEISSDEKVNYFVFDDAKLKELELPEADSIPFALSGDLKIVAVKTSSESSMKIKLLDISDGSVKNTIELPENFTSVQSGCFFDDGRLAFLHIDETDDLARRYTVSISTSEKLDDFDSYLIKEENTKDFISEYVSLGSVVERPVSIQCYKQALFITTSSIFSDMILITVYNFDVKKRQLAYLTAYYPIDPDSGFDMYFNPPDSTLYIFNNKRELISVKGNLFPVIRKFNEPGSVFFSPFSQTGFTITFLPDGLSSGKKEIRTINIGELPE